MIWILFMRFQDNYNRQTSTERFMGQLLALKKKQYPHEMIRFDRIYSKKELLERVTEIQQQEIPVSEWHVGGYGGNYGPKLGSKDWPELLSPYEWQTLAIPFSPQAQGWFYMEHAALWLAPYLATRYEITCYGWEKWRGSLQKSKAPQCFPPGIWKETANYDPVASLYAETFSDITVRQDEWDWIYKKIKKYAPCRVLDIGCGNGALLNRLAPMINKGAGVDVSKEAINIAAAQNSDPHKISFLTVEGPYLPFANESFNVVISFLSFRYLDWDPILQEIIRTLAPGGHLLIVDMTASTLKLWEWPLLIMDKLKNRRFLKSHPQYRQALNRLVTHPDWEKMLTRHPMHAQKDFSRYINSRFPDGNLEIINTGGRAKIIAFDSGPIKKQGALSHEAI